MKRSLILTATIAAGIEARTLSKTEVLSEQAQAFNRGCMRAMQSNPDNLDTSCIIKTEEVNLQLANVFDFSTYTSSTFDLSTLIDRYSEMQIYMMEEFEACMITEYALKWDQIMSSWAGLGGAISNLAF